MKPEKPTNTFPLYAHNSGKWAKKIKGRTYYFGVWDEPDEALKAYLDFISSLSQPAREPEKPVSQHLTVEDACDHFICHKDAQRSSGALSDRSFQDYSRTCKRLSKFFGYETDIELLQPLDFARYRESLAERWNPVSVGNEVTRVLTMLKWLHKNKLSREIEVSPCFHKPSALVARRYRRRKGKKLFSPSDIKCLLDESGVNMRSMILLGINGGFQNSDIERLPLDLAESAITTSWIEYPRDKTEVDRKCKLWRQTTDAMSDSLECRSRRTGTSDRFFIRADGSPYSSSNNDIAKLFRLVRSQAMLSDGGFSWLRKTFETAASSCCDQVAIDYIMGHVDASMAAVYRQEIDDSRLEKVSDHVLAWLTH